MDLVRPAPLRTPSLRPLLIMLILGLVIVATALALAASQPRLPSPFGLARNGAIVIASPAGDIVAVDPATGALTTLIGGPTVDTGPWFSNDGRRFVFARATAEGAALMIANADGTGVRELLADSAADDWVEWSPAGDRIAVVGAVGGKRTLRIVDADDEAAPTTLDLGVRVQALAWRPGHDQLVIQEMTGSGPEAAYYLVDADGSDLRPIPAPNAILLPALSPDGSALAYTSWDAARPGLQGRIHVVDLDSGIDRPLAWEGSTGTNEFVDAFSPDGTKLLIERFGTDPSYEVGSGLGYRLVVVPANGRDPGAATGPARPGGQDGASAIFSPDGTGILATYNHEGTTWLLDVAGGDGQKMPWTGNAGLTWQRLAP